MHDISHHLERQKKVLCFGKVILAFGPFLGFFGLNKVFGFFRPKKSQKQASGQNDLAAAHFFVLPHDFFFSPHTKVKNFH